MPKGLRDDVSMEFITGLPLSKGFTVVLVVVDHFLKYAHFGALPTNFNGHKVAELFLEIVVKHHGMSKTLVAGRDLLAWLGTIFERYGVGSSSIMGASATLGQYYYNTSYHNSIKMSPYQVLYGRLPLSLIPYPPGTCKVAAVDELQRERNEVTRQLKQNLVAAKLRTEEKANRTSSEMVTELPDEFKEGQLMEHPIGVCWSPEDATWEWLTDFQSAYPSCNLEDTVVSEDGGNVTPLVGRLGRGKWTKKAPKWQESFVIG
ncbi:ty3-gypsy retrotransposon protein [Tanacetum coccineum]|uniref:Ty3-gypsy retrotransposon protein n=1 Tax=Tanacetum coccineum TaxID=301880 RepID=A0ABQ5AID4_9ASTR